MSKNFAIFLSLIALPFLIQAQKIWTLQDCIFHAFNNNIELKQLELSIENQQITVQQSKLNLLPDLNANASAVSNWGQTVDQYTNQFANSRVASLNLYAQSSVTLFNGFQLLNTIKSENLELTAQKLDYEASREMMAMQIATAYLQILYGIENFNSKKEQVSLTQMQVDRISKLVDAGTLAKGDLLTIKSQLASDQSIMVQTENDLRLAYLNLKQLLDLPADTTFEIEIPNLELTSSYEKLLQPDVVYSFAEQNRPEIKSAITRINKSEMDLQIAKGYYMPTLRFTAGIGTGYSGANSMIDGNPIYTGYSPTGEFTSSGDTVLAPNFTYNTITKPLGDQFDENQNYSLGLYLSVPIFNKYQVKNNVSRSKIAIRNAELKLEAEKRDMRKTIEQSYTDAVSAKKQYDAAKSSVEALKEAFDYSEQKYNAGLINSYEYNDAKTRLETAKSEMLKAKYNYVFRVKILEFYFGRPIMF